ncbi:DAK2 domain-containing protein, partial [Carboxydocella sp. JDF658]|uniref:DAK2 domain-containing protein n=1 Tax=Carboxydocella sp. JDF658 TaxID=1926600 RepID=UPI0009D42871
RKASSAIEVWQAAVVAAEEGLQRTPELLPILRQGGVVDAGGQGLVILLRAMLASFQDQDVQWVLTKP